MRTFAIGDIHGCHTALAALDRAVGFRADDVIVTLGDYVDRGPHSKQVIEHLLDLSRRARLIPLLGNHEVMMLQSRKDRVALLEWTACGGDATLDSYGASSFADIPAAHWQFLDSCIAFHETDTEFFVHANADPHLDLTDQTASMLFWEFFDAPPPHQSGRRMICGHTPQHSGLPLNLGHAVCIDTWVQRGGWLTCLDTGSNIYWQSNQNGDVRSGALE